MSPARNSVRSRGSSSTTASDPREKVKDCCRKLVAFMCTQVGVGGLVVGYAIIGAFGFMSIEQMGESTQNELVAKLHQDCASELWKLTVDANIFNESVWRISADHILKEFQNSVVRAIKKGYDGRTPLEIWSFPAALMFCLSIFTMIGYGSMVPRTSWGKGATVLYAVFGIPLYVLYFMNMGKVLATTFRWLYTRIYECSREESREIRNNSEISLGYIPNSPQRIIVPSTACLWVIAGYVLTGTILFAVWEKWQYLDSCYYCVTSLCKIGIGDFVPGANTNESRSESQTKIVINFVYLLLGMGLIAMCFNLMREEIHVKMRETKEDLIRWLEDIRLQTLGCVNKDTSGPKDVNTNLLPTQNSLAQ